MSDKQIYVFVVEDEEAAKRMRQDEWSYACELPAETRKEVVDYLNELS